MKKILLTGGTGFIGSAVLTELIQREYEIHLITHQNSYTFLSKQSHVIIHHLDLLDIKAVKAFFNENSYENLIHLAWYVGPKCHISNINLAWLTASLNLLECFKNSGGKVFQCNGTVSEYDFAYGYLTEQLSPLTNKSFHGVCKSSFFRVAQSFCRQNGIIFKWSRCFNLYGPKEMPQRLVPSVILSCLRNCDVQVSSCLNYQDYLHVSDSARGIVDIFESELTDDINVCSGHPVQLCEIVNTIAKLTGFTGNILWGTVPSSFNDEVLVGNNSKLRSIGWKQKNSLEQGLNETINWWKMQNV